MLAEQLASYGRELSRMDDLFRCHYANIATVKKLATNKIMANVPYESVEGNRRRKMTFLKVMQESQKHTEKAIFDIFMDAVNRNDASKILEIAETVRFFKDKRHPFHVDADKDRRWLIFLKARLGDGESWPIRKVAEFLAGGKVETPRDGFSALRRKCRELNFPISPSRKTRRK